MHKIRPEANRFNPGWHGAKGHPYDPAHPSLRRSGAPFRCSMGKSWQKADFGRSETEYTFSSYCYGVKPEANSLSRRTGN
jgi:hypothetical protein